VVGVDDEVEVDVPLRPGSPRPELVELDELLGERPDDLPDAGFFVVRKADVEERTEGLPGEAPGDPDDEQGDDDGDERVQDRESREMDGRQAGGHADRGVDVRPEVDGVALQGHRVGLAGHAVEVFGHEVVHERRPGHDGDSQAEGLDPHRSEELPDRLEHYPAGGGENQESLHQRGDVLYLPVPEGVGLVGRPGGLPDREEGDERGHEVEGRVDGLRDDAHRAHDQAGDELDGDEAGVGDHR